MGSLLIIIGIIGFIITAIIAIKQRIKNKEKYFDKKYQKKMTKITIGFFVVAALGFYMLPSSNESDMAPIQKVTKLTAEQSQNIENILAQCGINDFTIAADKNMDNLQKAGEKAYVLKNSEWDKEAILLVAPNGTAWKILYSGHPLYENGVVVNKIQDYYMSDEEFSSAINTTKVIITQFAQNKNSISFDDAEWKWKKSPDSITIGGKMKVDNAFGQEVENVFIVNYTPNLKSATNIIINNHDYGGINL